MAGRPQRFIDTGKKGIGPGDLFLGVGMPILNNRTGERIGTSDAVELIVSLAMTAPSPARAHSGCLADTSTRRRGPPHRPPFRNTVTGGTGRYLGVGGQLTLREDEHRKVEVMRLELVR